MSEISNYIMDVLELTCSDAVQVAVK